MRTLILPQISLNGTSKRELVDQQLTILSAFRSLLDTMAQASPNGRDYQYRPEEFEMARAAWIERRALIENLSDEIERHAIAINDVGGP